MGQKDEENPVSDDEAEAEKEKLRPDPQEEMEMTKIPIKTRDPTYPEVIAGLEEPLIKTSHLRYLLYGFNGFLLMLGIALLSITIWVRVDPSFWEYESTLDVDSFYTVCGMLIFASLVVIFVAVLGILGAVRETQWPLVLYMAIFGIIFLVELAALVILWSAPYSKTIYSELDNQIGKQITLRDTDDSSRYFMDFIQAHLHCCGAKGVRDYGGSEAPRSCQDKRTGIIFPDGCATKLLTYLRSKAGIIGGVSLPILLVQFLALVVSGCLIKRRGQKSSYFM